MSLVTFKDLCVDAVDAATLGEFWARTLGLRVEPLDDGGGVVLRDPHPDPVEARTIWVNTVPESKTVKHRVHPDVRALSLDEFPDRPRLTEPGQYHYTTLADPEGGELCVFTYDEVPAYRLKDIVVDCADYRTVAAFWHELLGGTLTQDDAMDYAYLDEGAGVPFESFDFVPVPEPKTVKNRWHWDVTLDDGVTLDDLVARGARVLRRRTTRSAGPSWPTRRATSSASFGPERRSPRHGRAARAVSTRSTLLRMPHRAARASRASGSFGVRGRASSTSPTGASCATCTAVGATSR